MLHYPSATCRGHHHEVVVAGLEEARAPTEDWGMGRRAALRQQLALLRLHLWATGALAELMNQLGTDVGDAIRGAGDELTLGDVPGIMQRVDGVLRAWTLRYSELVDAVRTAAAWVVQGTASQHFGAMVRVALLQEQRVGVGFPTWDPNMPQKGGGRGGWSPVFTNYGPVVRQAQARVDRLVTGKGALRYSDGKNLSDRIWNLPKGVRRRALGEVANAASKGESAYTAAKRVERYLQPGQECPRWTSTRLRLTKSEIAAGNRSGLYSGSPCAMKGVSYNALRLMRNEAQIAHHAATDELFAKMPWVKMERIRLSPSHPDIGCECEEIVASGPYGDGTYRKGLITLPIHVNCLCYKTPVMMDPRTMARQLGDWLGGTGSWPDMDAFASWWGLAGLAAPFSPWDEESEEELELAEDAWPDTASRDLEYALAVLADGSEEDIDLLMEAEGDPERYEELLAEAETT
jgi:hypothetical protein